jgi:hypothetical protein
MSVVAKMLCHVCPAEITDQPQQVALGAVYEPDDGKRALPENAVFGKATPWGEIKMGIANPAAKAFFKPGKKYYVTFTEAPD